MLTKITLVTDGACSGNPGPGGYAGILRWNDKSRKYAGFTKEATNNRMELTAVVEGIALLRRPCSITVETDSRYVCTGIANLKEWKDRDWRLRSGATPRNVELWQKLYQLISDNHHSIHYQHIEGHSGNPDNEECDKLAREQIKIHMKGV